MLNITNNSIKSHINLENYSSYSSISNLKIYKQVNKWLLGAFGTAVVLLLLPWTQNIKSDGALTTLEPTKRPQTIVSVIPGRIDSWRVSEGDRVNAGDTIAVLSETKDLYFDPMLLERTDNQIANKKAAIEAYGQKVEALEDQVGALRRLLNVKLESLTIKQNQLRLQIASDSADLAAYDFASVIADKQADRTNQLYKDGLRSLTDLEIRDAKRQEATAGRIAKENKLASQRQYLLALILEIEQTKQEFREKLAKTESDKYSAITALNDAQADIEKLRTQAANYEIRRKNLFVTAPQGGIVSRISRAGLGETIKEGEELAVLLPDEFTLSAALYVKPMDLPLIKTGQKVRLVFDGWPALVFSGWPNVSFGTYGGVVSMIESQTSNNGLFRILVTPDPNDLEWPELLQLGSGVHAMSLLNDVPIWFEVWRQINGFPPSFYEQEGNGKNGSKNGEPKEKK